MRGAALVGSLAVGVMLVAATPTLASPPRQALWRDRVPFTNRVVSVPVRSGGFPSPGFHFQPGTCRSGSYDSNHSESALAVRRGTEHLVGASKFFFGKWSTFYNFSTGSYDITRFSAVPNVIDGNDCSTTGTQASPPTWTATTDPNLAFDSRGRVYDVVLAFNWYRVDGNVYASYSDDYGRVWRKGNEGRPIDVGPVNPGNGLYLDKPWVAVNDNPHQRFTDHVYGIWAARLNNRSAIRVAVSRDRGRTFSAPLTLPTGRLPAENPWPYLTVDAAGDLYAVWVTYSAHGSRFAVSRSRDDGRTWSPPTPAGPPTRVSVQAAYPGTIVHVGAPESFAASSTRPGHLYLAWEQVDGSAFSIRFVTSRDGGLNWSRERRIDDLLNGTDRIQPVVAAGPRDAVAVAFYDKRATCPRSAAVAPADRSARNTCIVVSVQPMRDTGRNVVPLGGNRPISDTPWDPNEPVQQRDGLGQQACDAHDNPCTDIFIGDYFGIAISERHLYTLSVTTAEPSTVASDAGGPLYYQQQVLATVDRADLGM